jgi:hypothetical protein
VALGNSLLAGIGPEAQQVVIITAFLRVDALRRILGNCSDNTQIEVFVRWESGDICSGASDLGAWDLAKERAGLTLFVCPQLHAKYYRGGRRIWVGSANLTMRGMGWARNPNVEILHEVRWDEHWRGWEQGVRDRSFPVTQALVDELAQLEVVENPRVHEVAEDVASPAAWIPSSKNPKRLLDALGDPHETRQALAGAHDDLAMLGITPGIAVAAGRLAIGRALKSLDVFRLVDDCVRESGSVRFGEVRRRVSQWLRDHAVERDGSDVTQLVYRWLQEFCPESYEFGEANYSEILRVRD